MSTDITKSDRRFQGLTAWAAGAVIALLLWGTGALDGWEAKTWDWRVQLLAEKGDATDKISLILIDQNSLDWGRETNQWSWPWPREVYGAVIRFCKRSGAKAVAVDMMFLEDSVYGVEDDQQFGQVISDYGAVAGAVFLGNKTGNTDQWPEKLPKPLLSIDGFEKWEKSASPHDIRFPKASFPVPEIGAAMTLFGNVHLEPDPDGVYRRVKPFAVFDDQHVPALGLGCWLAAASNPSASIAPCRLNLGGYQIPIDSEGNAVLRYRGPSGTHPTFSAAAVIQSEIRILSGESPVLPIKTFKNKYVIIGSSAPGLLDLRTSPVGSVYAGAEVHATLLDNFLSDDFIRLMPGWGVFLLLALLTAVCAAAFSLIDRTDYIAGIGLLFALVPVAGAFICYLKGVWLPLMACETAVFVTFLAALGVKYATEGRQKRFIKGAFRQYLSADLVEQIIVHPEILKLGGDRRPLSIFFSDLQSFTSISEKLTPEELTRLLNDYLTAMTRIIIEESGTVDKYEGDAIIAFWNAPLDVPDHALRCLQAALRCQSRLSQLRHDYIERFDAELHMRIGINTGDAVVGNFGSDTKFDYTMLGDAVNLAARLEGINKQFGTYTMISEATQEILGDAFAFRELGRVAVVGREEPVTVFEPMYHKEHEIKKEILKSFHEGLLAFYQGNFEEAQALFHALAKFDHPSAAYVKKCEELKKDPPKEWAGVWVMTQK